MRSVDAARRLNRSPTVGSQQTRRFALIPLLHAAARGIENEIPLDLNAHQTCSRQICGGRRPPEHTSQPILVVLLPVLRSISLSVYLLVSLQNEISLSFNVVADRARPNIRGGPDLKPQAVGWKLGWAVGGSSTRAGTGRLVRDKPK
jgi:hypothetical protein